MAVAKYDKEDENEEHHDDGGTEIGNDDTLKGATKLIRDLVCALQCILPGDLLTKLLQIVDPLHVMDILKVDVDTCKCSGDLGGGGLVGGLGGGLLKGLPLAPLNLL